MPDMPEVGRGLASRGQEFDSLCRRHKGGRGPMVWSSEVSGQVDGGDALSRGTPDERGQGQDN